MADVKQETVCFIEESESEEPILSTNQKTVLTDQSQSCLNFETVSEKIPKRNDTENEKDVQSGSETRNSDETDGKESERRMKTRSMTRNVSKENEKQDEMETDSSEDLKLDSVGAFWLTSEINECCDENITTLVVELPVKYHRTPEVQEAKAKEHENLIQYNTYEEINDDG